MKQKVPQRKPNEPISHYFSRNSRTFAELWRVGVTLERMGQLVKPMFPGFSVSKHAIQKYFSNYLTKEDRLARAIFDINKKSDGKTLIAPSSKLLGDDHQPDHRTDSQITNN